MTYESMIVTFAIVGLVTSGYVVGRGWRWRVKREGYWHENKIRVLNAAETLLLLALIALGLALVWPATVLVGLGFALSRIQWATFVTERREKE